MKSKSPHIEDLRSSVRHNTNCIPTNLISNDIYYDIPARLNNVSLGGFQIMCSNYAAQQLSKSKYSADGQDSEAMNIIVKILDKNDSKTFQLSCKIVYVHQNHSPSDYCSDAVGLEASMCNPENKRLLSYFIERNT